MIFVKALRLQRGEDRRKKLEAKKLEAKDTGREPFDLDELKKYWSYRFEANLTEAELAQAMKGIEDNYYLAGDRFMTVEAYGKHLMEMEFYR